MDANQRQTAQAMLDECDARGASALAVMAMLCLGWGENAMHSYGCSTYRGGSYCGVFQLNETWQAEHDYTDVRYWAGRALDQGFYGRGGIISLAARNPGQTPGWITNQCQGAFADGAQGARYYDQYQPQARQTLAELGHPSSGDRGDGAGQLTGNIYATDPSGLIRQSTDRLGIAGGHTQKRADVIWDLVTSTDYCTDFGPR